MCSKTDRDIGWSELDFLVRTYQIFMEQNLGLPSCPYCKIEPQQILTTEDVCTEHRMHIIFKPCWHVIGYVA